MKKNGKIMID